MHTPDSPLSRAHSRFASSSLCLHFPSPSLPPPSSLSPPPLSRSPPPRAFALVWVLAHARFDRCDVANIKRVFLRARKPKKIECAVARIHPPRHSARMKARANRRARASERTNFSSELKHVSSARVSSLTVSSCAAPTEFDHLCRFENPTICFVLPNRQFEACVLCPARQGPKRRDEAASSMPVARRLFPRHRRKSGAEDHRKGRAVLAPSPEPGSSDGRVRRTLRRGACPGLLKRWRRVAFTVK